MILNDDFLTFDGEPVPGRIPPKVVFAGQLTREQEQGVRHAYRESCRALKLSLREFGMTHRRLGDGTLVRIEHGTQGDRVFVRPPDEGGLFYEMQPAFWLNAPATYSDTMPPLSTVNSATWMTFPYDGTTNDPTLLEKFRKTHPGNVTWYDSRPDSKNRGLVLSWWSLADDRYGATWNRFSSTPETSPEGADGYKKLFCNGLVIGDLPFAVIGACISEIAGVPTICVFASPTHTLGDYPSSGLRSYKYGNENFGPGFGLEQQTIRCYHATMPGRFRQFIFAPLTFSLAFTINLAAYDYDATTDPVTLDGDSWVLHDPRFWYTAGIKFNSSGTAGIFPIHGTIDKLVAGTPSGTFRDLDIGLLMDPRSKSITAVDFSSATQTAIEGAYLSANPGYSLSISQIRPTAMWDYKTDTLVGITFGHIVLTNDVTPSLTIDIFWDHSSEYGLRDFDYTYPDPWLIPDITLTGSPGTPPAGASPDGARAGDMRVNLWTNGGGGLAEGSADSSFDGRFVVCRSLHYTHVFVDKVNVTTTLDALTGLHLQLAKFPVMCGNVARADRGLPAAKQYVKGPAP